MVIQIWSLFIDYFYTGGHQSRSHCIRINRVMDKQDDPSKKKHNLQLTPELMKWLSEKASTRGGGVTLTLGA